MLIFQVHMRVQEIQRVLDLIKDMNQGQKVENVLGANFDFAQFKVSTYKFQR